MKHIKTYKIFENSLNQLLKDDFGLLKTIIMEMLCDLTDNSFDVSIGLSSNNDIIIIISKFSTNTPGGWNPFTKEECIGDIKELISRLSEDFYLKRFWISYYQALTSWSDDINKLYEPTDEPLSYIKLELTKHSVRHLKIIEGISAEKFEKDNLELKDTINDILLELKDEEFEVSCGVFNDSGGDNITWRSYGGISMVYITIEKSSDIPYNPADDDDGFLYYLGPDEEEDIPITIKSYNSFGMDVIRPTIEHLTSLLEEHGIGLKFVTVWVATSVTHGHTERFDILPTDNILSRQVQLQYYKKDFPSDTKRTFINRGI